MISPIDLNNWSFSFTQKVLLNASQHKTSRSYQSELNKNFKSSKYKPLIKSVFSKVDSCCFDVSQCSPVRHVDHFIFSSLSVSSLAAICLLHFLFASSRRCSLWWRVSAECIYLYSFLVGFVEFSSTSVFTFIIVLL